MMEKLKDSSGRQKKMSDVKDVRSRSGVTQSRVELLWSGRELTTKVGNKLGLSSITNGHLLICDL